INLSILPNTSAQCFSGLDFYAQYLFIVITPLVLLSLLGGVSFGILTYFIRRDMSDSSYMRDRVAMWRAKIVCMVLFTILFLYDNLSIVCLRVTCVLFSQIPR